MLPPYSFAIIGGGPAGLAAAESLAQAGHKVVVYERKPSMARKFLLAGRGGLNITHSEELPHFLNRYSEGSALLQEAIRNFTPADMRAWCADLEEPCFVGTSGRVFPHSLKATPLLRRWLARLDNMGVTFCPQHHWRGWNENGALRFDTPTGPQTFSHTATLLALGGASWPHLGADGSWMDILALHQVPLRALRPANCGFAVEWSQHFREHQAGQPIKNVNILIPGASRRGEIMICAKGIEGGAIYALSAPLRDQLEAGPLQISIDLAPDLESSALQQRLESPRGSQSFSTWMQKHLALSRTAIALLRETTPDVQKLSIPALAKAIKAVPILLLAPFDLHRSISTAGGIRFEGLNEHFMIKAMPGTFAAGEMLDWEAPTGGYLLQGCFASGKAAATGMLHWAAQH